jgi:hypothetical protein
VLKKCKICRTFTLNTLKINKFEKRYWHSIEIQALEYIDKELELNQKGQIFNRKSGPFIVSVFKGGATWN